MRITYVALLLLLSSSWTLRAESETLTDSEVLSYAVRPLILSKQISLSKEDILENKEKSQTPLNVYEIDLSSADFSTAEGTKLLEYFKEKSLPRLRSINLSHSTHVKTAIDALFGSEAPKNLISLLKIDITESGATAEDVKKISGHFATYDHLVRDMPQISSRDDSPIVILQILASAPIAKGVCEPNPSLDIYYRAGAKPSSARFEARVL